MNDSQKNRSPLVEERFSDLKDYTPKKLRTLRNNLNNRIAHFEGHESHPKELKPSHRLYGLGPEDCSELLKRVTKILSEQ